MKRGLFFILLTLVLTLSPAIPRVRSAQTDDASPAPNRLRLWHAFGGDALPYFERMIADFNQTHPGWVVEAAPMGSYEDLLAAYADALDSQTRENPPPLPHILHLADVDSQRALDSGWFAPLAPAPGYFESLLTPYQADRRFYGVPWNMALPVLYANRQALDAAGVSALPATFADFSGQCAAFSAPRCAVWPVDAWLILNWLGGQGLDSPAAAELATWWVGLESANAYQTPRNLADWEDANRRFVEGEAAFLIGSTEDAAWIAANAPFEVMAGPVPGMGSAYVPRGGALWLAANLPEAEAAAAQTFMTWLTNTENSVRWHKGTGYLPLRPLSLTILEEQAWFSDHPAAAVGADQMANGQNVIQWRGPERDIRLLIEQAFQRMLQGNNIERTLADFQNRIQQAMDRYSGG